MARMGLITLEVRDGRGETNVPHEYAYVVQKRVDEVADEVFCRLPRISASAEASRCYELSAQTQDVFLETVEQRDVLASGTNTQMTSEAEAKQQDSTIRGLAEARLPLPNDRQGG